eukprot:1157596-Pelagomonas_calceolata.AAC.12
MEHCPKQWHQRMPSASLLKHAHSTDLPSMTYKDTASAQSAGGQAYLSFTNKLCCCLPCRLPL